MRLIIGLGGNVGDVRSAFDHAAMRLRKNRNLEVLGNSSLWRTIAVGPKQPAYLNAAILVAFDASPRELLEFCRTIEATTGRDRKTEARWGPRPLDLDLLIADTLVCRGPALELPHPRLAQRAFALAPAAEVAPEWVHPLEGRTLAEMAETRRSAMPTAVEVIGDW